MTRPHALAIAIGAALLAPAACAPQARLDSWTDGPARETITDFVARVTTRGSPDFVPPDERIAVFDNDGTLWCEQPAYAQLLFAMDRARALAPDHPDWAHTEPFRSAIAGDLSALAASGEEGLLELIIASHAGTTTEAFDAAVRAWIAHARHPRFDTPYTGCAYQPMLEMLDYLRAHGFKTYIVSGGGVEFIRAFSSDLYGVPPEQVIGSTIATDYEMRDHGPVLVRLPEIDFIDDKAGKPVAIHKFIGRRPVIAFGNSDGDLEMLQWTTTRAGPSLGVIIHHTDAEREYAYDRDSHVGRLDQALDLAPENGWIVVSTRDDWSAVFPRAD